LLRKSQLKGAGAANSGPRGRRERSWHALERDGECSARQDVRVIHVRENLQGVFTPRSGAERVAEGLQPIKADRAANVFITRFSVEVSRGSYDKRPSICRVHDPSECVKTPVIFRNGCGVLKMAGTRSSELMHDGCRLREPVDRRFRPIEDRNGETEFR
jgi:hypothetical protein